MKKIILYEYDKRNREDFLKQLEDAGYAFLSIMVGEDIKNVFGDNYGYEGVYNGCNPIF